MAFCVTFEILNLKEFWSISLIKVKLAPPCYYVHILKKKSSGLERSILRDLTFRRKWYSLGMIEATKTSLDLIFSPAPPHPSGKESAFKEDPPESYLTLSWRRSLSYRHQSIHLLCKSMDWFLYDRDLRHERVGAIANICDGLFCENR